MSRCWLCEYNKEEEAIKLSKFINDNIPHMGLAQISHAVSERLNEVDRDGEGHSPEMIAEHIKQHVLSPHVKVACMLRSLTGLLDKLEDGIICENEETGVTEIDSKNVLAYLKVVNEIMQIYKTNDCSKLMFADLAR
jgi:hypothetical protein